MSDGRLFIAGVSNFQPGRLDRIIAETGVVLAVNQIEVTRPSRTWGLAMHKPVIRVAVEAWSPIGQGVVLNDPVIGRMAAAHKKTVAQVTLRWTFQHGHTIFPKSMRRERMQENLDIFDFDLSADEMASLDGLDLGERGGRARTLRPLLRGSEGPSHRS